MIYENGIIKDWRKIDISFGLIYPNIFKLGMSSYSIRLLYFLINSFENIACERIFFPDNANLKFPASKDFTSKNLLRSLENQALPEEFDILGFSLHFENDFRNILWILEKAEIPLTFQERERLVSEGKAKFPLIIGGGPVITSNPIPLNKFFDVLFVGDAEQNLKLFFEKFLHYKNKEINFNEFLEKVCGIEGIFVPKIKNKVKRAIIQNLDASPTPIFQPIDSVHKEESIFEQNFLIEINRGCPYQCKFCISSFHNSPFRNKSYENIITSIQKSIEYYNFETISLIGSCVSSHPQFRQICEYIINNGKRLTIPSIRIEHLTQDIIKLFERAEIKTITIAPETGSESLRYALGKKISNENIISVLTLLRDSQIKNVKFYFLIGLPDEKEEHIVDIIDLLKIADSLGFQKDSLRVNVNPFVPKLNTPYEKEVFFYLKENLNTIIKKYQRLERELKNLNKIKLKFRNYKFIVKNARLQTMLSLGNQQLSDILLRYYYYGANLGALKKSENELNYSLDQYLLKIQDCYTPWII